MSTNPRLMALGLGLIGSLLLGPADVLLSRGAAGSIVGTVAAQPSGQQPPPADAPSVDTAPRPPDTRPKKPLTLMDATEAALQNNLIVAIRRKDFESAEQSVIIEDAAFDPLLGAEGFYGRSKSEPLSDFSAEGSQFWRGSVTLSQILKQGFSYSAAWSSSKDRTIYVPAAFQLPFFDPASPTYLSGLNLQFRQPILRNAGFEVNETGIEVAMLGVDSSEEVFRTTLLDTMSNVEAAYWDLKAAIADLDVQNTGLKLAQDLLDLNRKKVEVGTLAPIQITEAEASVASREQGVILAEASIRNAEDNLRRIMNIPPDAPEWDMAIDPIDPPPFEPKPIDERAMIQAALEHRPEIMDAINTSRAAEYQYKFASNQRKPQLDAVAEYLPRGNNYEAGRFETGDFNNDGTIEQRLELSDWAEASGEVFSNDIYDWSVGLQFSIPIGNREAKAREARSRISWEQSQLTLEDLKRNIQVEVRKAVLAVTTFQKSVEAARVNVTLQRKKLDAEQKRYDNGMSTSFQVLTFQNDLTAALSQEISAMTAYVKSLVALGRVTATLPEQRGITLTGPGGAPQS